MNDKEFEAFLKDNAPQSPKAKRDVFADVLKEVEGQQGAPAKPFRRKAFFMTSMALCAAGALFAIQLQRPSVEAPGFSDSEVLEFYEGLYGNVMDGEDDEYESSLFTADI